MSITIPTAPAPINAATVHIATAPVFQSGAGGVSVTTQQGITVTGNAIFGGIPLSATTPSGAASASIIPPALPPISYEIRLSGTLSINVPSLATDPGITVMTFANKEGQFTKVIPLVEDIPGGGQPLPNGTSRFDFISGNFASLGSDSLTVPKPNS